MMLFVTVAVLAASYVYFVVTSMAVVYAVATFWSLVVGYSSRSSTLAACM